MGRVAEIIVRGGKVSLGYGTQLLTDIRPEQFARLIDLGGRRVQANHPAFCYGHLSLYPYNTQKMMGIEPTARPVPESWTDLFSAGRECRDDPDGSIYPPMEEIVTRFREGYEALLASIARLPDDAFDAPNPREGRFKEMFPTVGGAVNFTCTCHLMVHAGQVSTWRRCMGLGPVM